jgi:Domain of unknown function (DUF3471)
VGFPDAVGLWTLDRILDNAKIDDAADTLKAAKTNFEADTKLFAKRTSPRPAPLAPLAGNFANPSVGEATVVPEGSTMAMEILASGAKLKLEPWDGDVFTVRLMPLGRFAAIAENLGPLPIGFVQFQIDKEGGLNLLRLSTENAQAYEFQRE